MLWREIENDFVAALRNPDRPEPASVTATPSTQSAKRFNVYRNNVAVSLSEALAAGYPVVKQLVGEEFFAGMAHVYAGKHLPVSPVMLYYGAEFPEFIETFAPAAGLPFLADVARIEQAWYAAYHAEDCEAIGIEQLQDIEPDKLETVQFILHPSCKPISSKWPAVSIWHIHRTQDDPAAAMQQLSFKAEAALIVRPRWSVDVRPIPDQAFRFFDALQKGTPFGLAAEPLIDAEASEMGRILQLLFTTGSVVGLSFGATAG